MQVLDCPVCGKMYDRGQQDQFEEHVQEHFQEQVSSAGAGAGRNLFLGPQPGGC